MASRPPLPARPPSAGSILLAFTAAHVSILVAVLFLAACSRQVPVDGDVAETRGERTSVAEEDGSARVVAKSDGSKSTATQQGPEPAGATEGDGRQVVAAEEKAEPNTPFSKAASPQRMISSDISSYAGQAVLARAMPPLHQNAAWNTERYDSVDEGGFLSPTDKPLSTFSVDVDTASYSNIRRFLIDGSRPPEGAVRIEEMVNYFRYPSEAKAGDHPFAVETELFTAPWAKNHRLARIALTGREMPADELPPRNLVFLLDVSGSMQGPDRLGLVKRGLTGLVEGLRAEDRVAIVVYAGASGLALPPTPGDQRDRILGALEALTAGGSTHGADGIRLAYETARKHFDGEGINRVILATDGDFNVGVTSRSELVEMIEKERESGVFLTVLGFGRGNLNDAGMEELADKGNGNYAYIDSPAEARKVLVNEAGSTLVTIAKDVKIQVEFNPARVAAYRLIGYENRRLADRDFNDDKKDAGEIGAGHHVTALYEIVPTGVAFDSGVDPLKYQKPAEREIAASEEAASADWLTVKLRYKAPRESKSQMFSTVLAGEPVAIDRASESGRFTAAVALFGMLLQESEFRGEGDFDLARTLARDAMGADPRGERAEFVRLVALAKELKSS